MATDVKDGVLFSSGRQIYTHANIVGLDKDGALYHGYDGDISWPPYEDQESPLSADDMRELADLMIERWTKFKAGLT